jgi:hypothetical protein
MMIQATKQRAGNGSLSTAYGNRDGALLGHDQALLQCKLSILYQYLSHCVECGDNLERLARSALHSDLPDDTSRDFTSESPRKQLG